jgi:hypothetical protein
MEETTKLVQSVRSTSTDDIFSGDIIKSGLLYSTSMRHAVFWIAWKK